MKIIHSKTDNFQTFYASDLMTAIFFVAAIEIYVLAMFITGGAR